MKAFLEEYFIHILVIVVIVLLLWIFSYTIPTEKTCLSLGYPDSKVLFYFDGARAFCFNQLEAIEIPLPK